MFRYVILGLLRDGVPRHGYALMKRHREGLGVKISTGNFYRELPRLAGEGLVRSSARLGSADGRQAPYEITTRGAAAFDAWFEDASGVAAHMAEDQLSARLLFLPIVPRAMALDVLARWEERLWARAKLLEQRRAEALGPGSREDAGFPILPIVLGRRLRHVAADIALVGEVRATYEEWAAAQAVDATVVPPVVETVEPRLATVRRRGVPWAR